MDFAVDDKAVLLKRSVVNVSDIDECAANTTNDCDPMTTSCVNQQGTFTCSCLRGFYGPAGNRTCTGSYTSKQDVQPVMRLIQCPRPLQVVT